MKDLDRRIHTHIHTDVCIINLYTYTCISKIYSYLYIDRHKYLSNICWPSWARRQAIKKP